MTTDTTTHTFTGGTGRDEFKREQVADKVITLLASDIQLSPMVIDGDWGTGKTEFCHKLINKFKDKDNRYKLLYVDAFQADHADNPLMTILSAVLSLVPDQVKKENLLKKAIPVVRHGLAVGAKAVVSYVLKQNAEDIGKEFSDIMQDSTDKAIDASVEVLLREHEKIKENLQALQTTLADIAKDAPIVIFIDELDRCRPDFAVQMLEVIKHTFDVEGVQFVLITNTRQLKAAINHRYGPQVDAQRYLDKFLKFSFSLPDFVPGQRGMDNGPLLAATEHFSTCLKQSSVLSETNLLHSNQSANSFANSLISTTGRSLREVETFVRHLEIYQQLSQGLNSQLPFGRQLLGIFGVFIFCFYPEIAEAVQTNKTDANQIATLFGLRELPDYKPNGASWSYATDIAVMLAQASTENKEKFIPTDSEAKNFWAERKNRLLQDSWGRVNNDVLTTVKEAIVYLRLGST